MLMHLVNPFESLSSVLSTHKTGNFLQQANLPQRVNLR
jgi:hypothetical protein